MSEQRRMNSATRQRLLEIVRFSLWGTGRCEADAATFAELERHGLLSLTAPALSTLDLPEELRRTWQKAIQHQMAHNLNCQYMQESLPVQVPYVILKGSSAAQYYPQPEYRALGDIDLMTRREDLDAACDALLAAGFAEDTTVYPSGVIRHRSFFRDHIEVEVHIFFAMLPDPAHAEYLDDQIIAQINPTHVLPDSINGMVLLEHINQHLEKGLGLRQVLDWMMFVHRCLPDEAWPDFQPLLERTGLETLAVTLTRMCERHLGLPPRAWSARADERLCDALMDYVLEAGNFGARQAEQSEATGKLMTSLHSPKTAFTMLQQYGLVNWEAGQRHAFLRPFAWLHQLGRYLILAVTRKAPLRSLRGEVRYAQDRRELLNALGAEQFAQGHAVYQDGAYRRE